MSKLFGSVATRLGVTMLSPWVRKSYPSIPQSRLGRLPVSVDVLGARLRADHRPHPPAAALTSAVPGTELRHLLVLPAQARFRPTRSADSISPFESAVGGDDLLRLRQVRLAPRRRR